MAAQNEEAGHLVKEKLQSGVPCLIGRFGSIEMEAIMAYLYRDIRISPLKRFYRYASWDIRYQGWAEELKSKLSNNAGFFPTTENMLDRFAELYLEMIPQIDILGSWIHAETMIRKQMLSTSFIPLAQLEPYFSSDPWSSALKGLKVLVIHPFEQTIRSQYSKRESLFKNPEVLPPFKLKTIKAVQSSGNNPVPFDNWFSALDTMKAQMEKVDFDIALIGAGAYGLPLAAHAKVLGKQAVHLGGATQMLFGIYGQRWINDPLRKQFINENWVRPSESDKIKNSNTIENGCYW